MPNKETARRAALLAAAAAAAAVGTGAPAQAAAAVEGTGITGSSPLHQALQRIIGEADSPVTASAGWSSVLAAAQTASPFGNALMRILAEAGTGNVVAKFESAVGAEPTALQRLIADADRRVPASAGWSNAMSGVDRLVSEAEWTGPDAAFNNAMGGLQRVVAEAGWTGPDAAFSNAVGGLQRVIAEADEDGPIARFGNRT